MDKRCIQQAVCHTQLPYGKVIEFEDGDEILENNYNKQHF